MRWMWMSEWVVADVCGCRCWGVEQLSFLSSHKGVSEWGCFDLRVDFDLALYEVPSGMGFCDAELRFVGFFPSVLDFVRSLSFFSLVYHTDTHSPCVSSSLSLRFLNAHPFRSRY
jgi:hypothetical protein